MPLRWTLLSLASVALLAGAAYAVRGQLGSCGSGAESASCSDAKGSVIANDFDPVMSGVCRFSCATEEKYEARDVVAQPGALPGKLTRCPVSGVVFAVDDERPRTQHDDSEYVFCCDRCREKFVEHPGRFLKS